MTPLPDPSDPMATYLIGVALLDAAAEAIAGTTTGAAGRVLVQDGAGEVHDSCCEEGNGQVWAAWQRSYPTATFPVPLPLNLDPWKTTSLVHEFEVGVVRCAPVQDEEGEPPTAEAVDASAQRLLQDQAALLKGVTCQLRDWHRKGPWSATWVEARATEGGDCTGTVITVLVGFPLCVC